MNEQFTSSMQGRFFNSNLEHEWQQSFFFFWEIEIFMNIIEWRLRNTTFIISKQDSDFNLKKS